MNKFRVYDNQERVYVEEYLDERGQLELFIRPDGKLRCYEENDSCVGVRELDPERYIVERFTGFCDRNGKEVFFGDVMVNKKENLWIVAFDQTECKAVLRSKGKDLMLTHTVRSIEEWAVTGSIHDGEVSDG